MSTNSTPQPLTQTELLDNLHTEFANLAHKHATVSYLLIGILALVVSVAAVGGYFGLKSYDAQIAKAEAMQTQYVAAVKDFQTQLAAATSQRAQDAAKVQVIERTVTMRDQQANQAIQNAVDPNKTSEQVRLAFNQAMGGFPDFKPVQPSSDGNIVLQPTQAQQVTAVVIDRNRLSADLVDEKAVASLQTGTISSLNNNLNQCTALEAKAQATIDQYNKAARRGKLRKFFDGAVKYAGPVVGVIIGYSIHH